MATLYAISRLYDCVLRQDLVCNNISAKDIRAGIRSMSHVYAPSTSNFNCSESMFANFNEPAYRCAYLHKYAPLHTFIVQDTMIKILRTVSNHFHNLQVNNSQFKICSLGGGPGSDVIGVLTALYFTYGTFHSSVTIIDSMKKWEETFSSILHKLTVRPFDQNWSDIWNYNNCQWHYIECNLLGTFTNEVNNSIANASLITMVKFVSAAICSETENMVDKIFQVMKLRAMVLFIDNAAGGFTQIIERAGKRNGFVPIFGPLKHVEYETEALKIERFGYTSCFKTKVTIILLQKVLDIQKTKRNPNSFPNTSRQIAPVAKSPEPVDFVVLNNDSSRSKMANSISFPRPSEVIDKPSVVVMPQKPHSGAAINQNRIGNNSISNSVRSTPVLNTYNLPTAASGLQKPNGQMEHQLFRIQNGTSNVPNSAKPGSRSSNVNAYKALTNSNRSLMRDNSDVPFEQQRSTIVAPPISPRRIVPTPRHESRPKSGPTTTVRTYQPAPGNRSQREQPLREENENWEETCCSCCTIS